MNYHRNHPKIFLKIFLAHFHFLYCLTRAKRPHKHSGERIYCLHNRVDLTIMLVSEISILFSVYLHKLEKYYFLNSLLAHYAEIDIYIVTDYILNLIVIWARIHILSSLHYSVNKKHCSLFHIEENCIRLLSL